MDDFPGMPTKPLSRDELRRKFLMLTRSLPAAERVFTQLIELESIARVSDIQPE
jgi:hypothetical protein